jgi:nucleoside-diphosphate-sugar epimerase
MLIEDRGCRVVGIDNLSVGHREYLHPKSKFVWHDLYGSDERLATIYREHEIEYAFMVAAIPFVPDGFKRPLHTFEITATAVLKALNAAQMADIKGTLVISSAEIFGSSVGGSIDEQSEVKPHSTYAVAKQAADSLVQCRWHESGVRSLAARQFNSYGPRCLQPLVLTTIISQLSEGPHVKLGNDTTRDFQYCEDTVRIWIELLETEAWGEVVNCGSESCIKIYDLARLVGKVMGHDEITIEVDPSRVRTAKVEVQHLLADCTKLHSMIGYRERTPLEDGIRKTVEWFRANDRKWGFER